MEGNKFTQVTLRLIILSLCVIVPTAVGLRVLPPGPATGPDLYGYYAACFGVGGFLVIFGGAILGIILHILYCIFRWVWTGVW